MSASGLSADISITTLIGEANAGSLVWPQGTAKLPFDVGQYRPRGEGAADGLAAGGAPA